MFGDAVMALLQVRRGDRLEMGECGRVNCFRHFQRLFSGRYQRRKNIIANENWRVIVIYHTLQRLDSCSLVVPRLNKLFDTVQLRVHHIYHQTPSSIPNLLQFPPKHQPPFG